MSGVYFMLIVASVGLNVTENHLTKMILAGADVLRFNLSHHSIEKNSQFIRTAEQIIYNLNSSVQQMIDFPLNKIRLGYFDSQIFSVQENQEITLRSASFSPDCNDFIPVNTPKIGEKVKINEIITIGDGEISIQVTEISSSDIIKARVFNNGTIRNTKTLNINAPGYSNEEMKDIYRKTLNEVLHFEPNYIALTYDGGEFTKFIKEELLPTKPRQIKIVAKIEKEIPLEKLQQLCLDPHFDIVLVDRGELGVNMPFERIGLYQKQIVSLAKKTNKLIWISTQILMSTITNFIPNKAEITDLTNIVLEGANGIVFGYETGSGKRPAYTISTAKKIIKEVESFKARQQKN
jgi:pyruvate kinase